MRSMRFSRLTDIRRRGGQGERRRCFPATAIVWTGPRPTVTTIRRHNRSPHPAIQSLTLFHLFHDTGQRGNAQVLGYGDFRLLVRVVHPAARFFHILTQTVHGRKHTARQYYTTTAVTL